MPMILPATQPPVRPDPVARISTAHAGLSGNATDFGKTLSRATKADKNDAADRSGRKAAPNAEPKETPKPVDRDAVDESLSHSTDESDSIESDPTDVTRVGQSSTGSPEAQGSVSDATDAGGTAQDSPNDAQNAAQEPAGADPSASDTGSKSAAVGVLPVGQSAVTNAALINAAARAASEANSANRPGTQPDVNRPQLKRSASSLLPQATASSTDVAQQAPENPDAATTKLAANAAAASAALSASARRDDSKNPAQVSAPTGVSSSEAANGSTSQRVQSLPEQAAVTQLRPTNSNGNKSKSTIELKAAPTENQPMPGVAPASARAAQVEAAVRMENAMALLANAPESDASARAGAAHAAQSVAGPKLADATASGPTLAQQMQSWSNPEDQEFSGQMTRGLAAMMNQRGGVMTMRLNPPELGEVRVQMTLSRGVVSAEFQASTAQAHALLDKNLTVLRNALEGQGLTVDRLNVHAVPGPGTAGHSTWRDESSGSWNQHGGSSQHRHDHDAANGESRGRQEHGGDGQQRWTGEADFTEFFQDFEATFTTLETRNAT